MTVEDLINVEPIKVSKDARSASLMILGNVKTGKSTFMNNLYGERILFIGTEYRHNFIAGAKVINITSYPDYLRVMKLVRDPKIKEQYDAVVVDTFTRLQEWVENYTLSKLDIDDLGDLPYGAGHAEFKKEMNRAIELIETCGLVPHFIVHTKTVVKQVQKDEISEENVQDGMTLIKDKKSGKEFYEYNKDIADVKPFVFNSLNRVCDNILFFDVAVDENFKEHRRIWYRDNLFHVAGSSLKYMPEWTDMSVEAYLEAFKKAVEQEDESSVTDAPKEKPRDVEESEFDYDALMSEVAELGKKMQESNKAKELSMLVEEVLGKGRKVRDLEPNQSEILSVLVDKLREKVQGL